MNRYEIRRAIPPAAHAFVDEMYDAHPELGNIAGEFLSLNVDYVLLHQGSDETYRTLHILETGFSNNQKKYLEQLCKHLEESDVE